MPAKTIAYTEAMVGSGHPSLADTLNRLALVSLNTDGTMKAQAIGSAIAASSTKVTPVDADALALMDSATGNILTNLTIGDIKTSLAATFVPVTYLDTDGTLAADSNTKIATQKAVVTYTLPLSYLDIDGTMAANSDTKVASQRATKTLITTTAFATALPLQTGNSGKFVTTNGTVASWTALPTTFPTVQNVSTNTTLTNAPTATVITPTGYGTTITLPDATTCSAGLVHVVQNRGSFPVRICNNATTLLGFLMPGDQAVLSPVDISTTAGVWTAPNLQRAAQVASNGTSGTISVLQVLDLSTGKELLLYRGTADKPYGIVYNRLTNTFGAAVLIRDVALATQFRALVIATDTVLFCSANTTDFEAVILSISGTTITVNTPTTATLADSYSSFGVGSAAIVAVGSSYVIQYRLGTPALEIRAMTVSGTTVTIGNATVLSGTNAAFSQVAASSSILITVTTATSHIYTKPYTISGTTISAGTGTDTNNGTMTLNKFAAMGSGRWVCIYNDGGGTIKGAFVTLNTTTTTISTVTTHASGTLKDAIIVNTLKVALINNANPSVINVLTDNGSGTASAGTGVNLTGADGTTNATCLYVNGTDVWCAGGTTTHTITKTDCSGASPVLTQAIPTGTLLDTTYFRAIDESNINFTRSPTGFFSTNFATGNGSATAAQRNIIQIGNGNVTLLPYPTISFENATAINGINELSVWQLSNTSTALARLIKLECSP